MALRLVALSMRQHANKLAPLGTRTITYADKIGNRDVVGYGWNGLPIYHDRVDYPMPAIRWKENTSDVKALREKEKGDWKKLSMQEKKALYRASFRQTFSEIKAPTGEWKMAIGAALIAASLAMWIAMWMKVYGMLKNPSSNQRILFNMIKYVSSFSL